MWESKKIIQLINDTFRKTFQGGKIVLTRGIRALPKEDINQIMLKVNRYNEFTTANDPYEEHDYGSFDYNGIKIIWKIDYYDKNYEFASENPADVTKTNRVLTVILADEY